MEQKKMQDLKSSYKQINMTERQVKEMKKTISNAKKAARTKTMKTARWIAAAAAIAAVLILPPNISREAAYAMSSIPVVGRLVEEVTFRNYQYEDERNIADVNVTTMVTKEDDTDFMKKTKEEINAEIKEITSGGSVAGPYL